MLWQVYTLRTLIAAVGNQRFYTVPLGVLTCFARLKGVFSSENPLKNRKERIFPTFTIGYEFFMYAYKHEKIK